MADVKNPGYLGRMRKAAWAGDMMPACSCPPDAREIPGKGIQCETCRKFYVVRKR